MDTENSDRETAEVKTPLRRLFGLTAYFTGTVEPLDQWVAGKPFPLRFLNACFRAFGQPIFLNNPVSGIVIMVALFVQSPWQACCGILGLLVAQMTALATKQPKGDVDSGGVAFQGLLTGLVIPVLTGVSEWQGMLLLPVIVFSIFRFVFEWGGRIQGLKQVGGTLPNKRGYRKTYYGTFIFSAIKKGK